MSRPPRTVPALRAGLILALAWLLSAAVAGCGGTQPAHAAGPRATVEVTSRAVGPAEASGFLGLSMEYKDVESYTGASAAALDMPFVSLLKTLSPASGLVLRIGGDSTDWTWWPTPGSVAPGGVRFALGPNWSAVTRALARRVQARLILGINLEADNRSLAAYEAEQLLSHLGSSTVQAFELGNEPELYAAFPWYRTATGRHVYGRTRSYNPTTFAGDWAGVASLLPPGVEVAGPSSGGPEYLGALGGFVAHEPRLSLVTVHAYPLKHCVSTRFAKAGDFFTRASLQGLADHIGALVALARARRLPLRVDEMNSISCGGQKGLSQSFAPALWALDMLPRILRTGAVGVNFHTVPNTNQALIAAERTASGWRVHVEPEYLGLVAFAQAAPVGSRLLHVVGSGAAGLDVWATRSAQGYVHVVVINPTATARPVRIGVAGASGAAAVGWLRAPSLNATSGVTLDGLAVKPTTGTLSGTPAVSTVRPTAGAYAVTAPARSATILSLGGA